MSPEPVSSPHAGRSRPSWPAWLDSRAFWAGVSIVTMWLVVLFVAIFGGNILSSTPGGTSTSVPVVVVVIPFVLVGTVVVAHAGLRGHANAQLNLERETARSPEVPVAVPPGPQSRAA